MKFPSCLKLVGKFFVIVYIESKGFMKILSKVNFQDLENRNLLGKYSNHLKNIETRMKNDPFHKSSMNNIFYFARKY